MKVPKPFGLEMTGTNEAWDCLRFVLGHLFDRGVECSGAEYCILNGRCGKTAALLTFSTRRFAAEEEAMRQGGYDELDAHARDHGHFLGQLNALPHSHHCHETVAQLKRLIDHWVRGHQETFDRDFRQWAEAEATASEFTMPT